MKLAILDLCVWLEEYQSGQDKFGTVIAKWLARGLPDAEMTVIDVVEGEALPPLCAFDGFVISGSDKGVYDETPWMNAVRTFLLDVRAAGKPVFGICFGHQIMADVFGGKAEKVGPPQVGVREFASDGQTVSGHVWHQDQVTEVPPGASVIASADYCPVAALAYDFPALSVQFHPEYSADYVSDFLSRSRGAILSEDVSDAVIAELSTGKVAPDLFAEQASAFFRSHIDK